MPPLHWPPEQVSGFVHLSPSSHELVLLVCVHPEEALQVSVVHTLLSSQFGAVPGAQAPPEQVSTPLQALLSLHEAVLAVCTQPVAGLHVSSVHTSLSLQLGAGPPTHFPAEQVSPVVHSLPSLQDAPLALTGFEHAPVVVSQTPTSWHWSLPGQVFGVPPAQGPPRHDSPEVQGLES